MENIPIELLQGGAVLALAVFTIREGFNLIKWMMGKNGYDKKTYEVGQKIATNDLVHINDCLDKGFEKLSDKQDKTNQLLFEMLGLMKAQK